MLEVPVIEKTVARLADYYTAHEDDAKKLIAVGESKPDETVQTSLLAAWTMTANEMMNLDEVLNK